MRVLSGCWRLQVLGAALAVSMTIGFTIQLWGVSFQNRPNCTVAPSDQRLCHLSSSHLRFWQGQARQSTVGLCTTCPAGKCSWGETAAWSDETDSRRKSVSDIAPSHEPLNPSRASLPQLLPPTPWAPLAEAEAARGEEEGLPCQPRQHLLFLKTHKTGSSTIVNILHRFGDTRGLRFALPTRYQFSYPNLFQARQVKGWHPRGRPFDILCHHMRFNLHEVQKVMHPDTFYFSIVRDPVALAESAFSYYRGVVPAFRRAGSLPEFLASPQRFYRLAERGSHYARNLLWFDFGLDLPPGSGLGPIRATLAGLERTFHLVLLTEYMDESLVLLRSALCWSLDDVVAFRHNLRSPEAVRPLAPVDAARLRAWNHLDWHLYTHFNRTFWDHVEQFGRARMVQEVAALRKRRVDLGQRCLQGGGPLDPGHIADERIRPFQFGQVPILGYALQPSLAPGDQELCQRMVIPELQYKDLLDAKQFPAPLQGNGSQNGGVR